MTTWLTSHGFANVQVNAGHTFLEFSGNAGAVRTAFHTSIHRYDVHDQQHFANASDPKIPAGLAPVVAGVASLNNFPRRAANRRLGNFRRDLTTNVITRLPDSTSAQTHADAALSQPSFTLGSGSNTSYGVSPYDFAAIYNVLPLWNESTPIDGTGQTIAIVGETDINPADFVNFRKLFGLPLGNTATATGTQFLNILYNGPNPGVTGDEAEADIDTQWSGAVAKGATIDYVVSQSTELMQGTDLSAIYIVDNNLAPVMSYSYSECELFLGSAGNAFYNTLWQQAAAQGITVLVASGDSGSAGCDNAGADGATDGVAINGLGSTPYNVAVGGTDFYMPNGGTAFWNAANNSSTEASAKGYIPEAPWNQSCTNGVFTTGGAFSGETPEQVCNNSTAIRDGFTIVTGGGGGASTCTQSDGLSAASCTGGYGKPSWQTGSGIPVDGSRDVPDVSLFASAGFFGAFYVICQQSSDPEGQPCSLTDFAGYGGTSVATPAFAGILSMVNQKTGSRMGNADYALYSLANQQARSGISCNSTTGTPASGCIFNDVTSGTIAMPCLKTRPTAPSLTHPTATVFSPDSAALPATILPPASAASTPPTSLTAGPALPSSPRRPLWLLLLPRSPMAASLPPLSKCPRIVARPPAASRSVASLLPLPSWRAPSRPAPTQLCLATSLGAPTRFKPTMLATAFTQPATPTRSPSSSRRRPAPSASSRSSTEPHPAAVQLSRPFRMAIIFCFAPTSPAFRGKA